MVHRLHADLLRRAVRVLVVGCGGTGSAVLGGLPYLHQAMLALGHPGGLEVTALDGDRISTTNCVRQPFSEGEIGLFKAVVLVNRLNLFWSLNWRAEPEYLTEAKRTDRTDLVIGCVDTRAARSLIATSLTGHQSNVGYWLDIGNNANSGQIVLGEPWNWANRRSAIRLRTVAELFPEIVDANLDDDGEPSCSAVQALERQEPFVNQTLAYHALALLAGLFRCGEVGHHGTFINLASGRAVPLPIEPECWKRMRRRRVAVRRCHRR